MTENEIIEARRGLKIKNLERAKATGRIADVITQCYNIRKIKPESSEILTTAELVYKQMYISYNLTAEELLLACEDAIFNQNLTKPFNCSAESIIAALRTYRSSDAYLTVISKEGRTQVKEERTALSKEDERRLNNRLIRYRMQDIRCNQRHPRLSQTGALLFDYLVEIGKMDANSWKRYEAEGLKMTEGSEAFVGNIAWSTEAVINAKEIALNAKLEQVVAEELAELK